jgi:DNA-binding Lrp family transcriptional regulator
MNQDCRLAPEAAAGPHANRKHWRAPATWIAVLDLNLAAVGRGVQALIAIRIRPPSRRNIEGFRNWTAQLPETIGVFVVSGTEDFLVHIAVKDNQDLYAFVIDRLTQRPEVADVRTSVVYEHLHKTQITPNT